MSRESGTHTDQEKNLLTKPPLAVQQAYITYEKPMDQTIRDEDSYKTFAV